MACRGCSSSTQRRSSSYGCRKALQSARWSNCTNYYSADGCCANNCTNNCSSNCTNNCGNCVNNCGCNTCSNSCTNNCGCNNGCIQPRSTSANCTSNSRSNSGCRSCGCSHCSTCSNSPFYYGPCGPVDPVCGCNNGCGCCSNCGCNNCCSNTAVYGYFTQEGGLDIAAGDIVPFNGTSSAVGILKSGGELTLTESGAYMISLSVMIPANVTLTTDFVTLIDDGIAAGGTVMIDKTQTNLPLNTHVQTVVSAAAGSVISVVSSEDVNLSTAAQIVALNIVKVG